MDSNGHQKNKNKKHKKTRRKKRFLHFKLQLIIKMCFFDKINAVVIAGTFKKALYYPF